MIVDNRKFHGYGEDPAPAPAADQPSRALWFLFGVVAVYTGPVLLNVFSASGRKAARHIDK